MLVMRLEHICILVLLTRLAHVVSGHAVFGGERGPVVLCIEYVHCREYSDHICRTVTDGNHE